MLGWGLDFEGGVERSMTHCGGGGMEESIAGEGGQRIGRDGWREVDGAWRMMGRWSALQGELEPNLGKPRGKSHP